MSRFKERLKTFWLVCKRNGCNRDLRRVMLSYANMFDWETEELINEKLELRPSFSKQKTINLHLRRRVEVCPEFPFPLAEDKELVFQCIRLKIKNSQLENHWMRLFR